VASVVNGVLVALSPLVGSADVLAVIPGLLVALAVVLAAIVGIFARDEKLRPRSLDVLDKLTGRGDDHGKPPSLPKP
jgi:hypothetical protein